MTDLEKPKKQLSEKQLAALAKGRETRLKNLYSSSEDEYSEDDDDHEEYSDKDEYDEPSDLDESSEEDEYTSEEDEYPPNYHTDEPEPEAPQPKYNMPIRVKKNRFF